MSGSIGANTFTLLLGNVNKPTQGIEVLEKPGEDGIVRRQVGVRLSDFQLESVGTYANKAAARTALETFDALKTAVSQDLVKDGENYTTAPASQDRFKVIVLDVEQLSLVERACIAGTTDTWELRVRWTLRPDPQP